MAQEKRLARHVQAALSGAQRVADFEKQKGPAAHVRVAVAAIQQKQGVPERSRAAHVERVVAVPRSPGAAQGKVSTGGFVASHVQAAIRSTGTNAASVAQGKLFPPRPPVPARHAVIQRMQEENPDPIEKYDPEPWKKYEKKSKQKVQVSSEPSINVTGSSVNLDSSEFNVKNLTTKSSANDVRASAFVDQQSVQISGQVPSKVTNDITRPDSSAEVVNTTNDGEVSVLPPILAIFLRMLDQAGAADISFEVRLSGAWGACDGCKKRILKFGGLWAEKAAQVMQKGKKATLTISYYYLNAPEDFSRSFDSSNKKNKTTITYGWPSDANQNGGKGPFGHQDVFTVTGA